MGNSVQQPKVKENINLTGKVIVITGANLGLGFAAAKQFAKLNGTVIFACRNQEKTLPKIQELQKLYPQAKLDFIRCDLQDFESVVQFGKQFSSKYNSLDILMNNASHATPQKERQISKQGLELQMATNHFGHYLLTNQLMPLLKKTKQSRIINVSSMIHAGLPLLGMKAEIDFDDINVEKNKFDQKNVYFATKLANVLFTLQLQKQLETQNQDIKVVSLNPIGTDSESLQEYTKNDNIFSKLFFKMVLNPADKGVVTHMYCSLLDYVDLVGGGYYDDQKIAKMGKNALNVQNQQKLWDISQKLLQPYLSDW